MAMITSLQVAWAPGIGIKESPFKQAWDVDEGVTYVPWDKLPQDVSFLLEGGMVDDDTLPDRLKGGYSCLSFTGHQFLFL